MTKERTPEFTPRMQQALSELQALISKRYPDATFRVTRSPENPETVLLKPVVDVDDRDEVMDVVIDRLGSCKARNSCPCWLCLPAQRRATRQYSTQWNRPSLPGTSSPLCQVLMKVNFPAIRPQPKCSHLVSLDKNTF